MEQLTINKQTPSDVYCRPCHNVGVYFHMKQETFFNHLKREHNSIIDAVASCSFWNQKFNNLNMVKKHIFQHKELKFKEIPKYQQQSSANFDRKKILQFPTEVDNINGIFIMLRDMSDWNLIFEIFSQNGFHWCFSYFGPITHGV